MFCEGAAINNPFSVPDSVKGVAAAAVMCFFLALFVIYSSPPSFKHLTTILQLLGGAVLVPTFLIKVIGGY